MRNPNKAIFVSHCKRVFQLIPFSCNTHFMTHPIWKESISWFLLNFNQQKFKNAINRTNNQLKSVSNVNNSKFCWNYIFVFSDIISIVNKILKGIEQNDFCFIHGISYKSLNTKATFTWQNSFSWIDWNNKSQSIKHYDLSNLKWVENSIKLCEFR